jgi:hypothetical protein
MASFVANYWVADGIDIYQLKLTGFVVHLINAFLVYVLSIILIRKTTLVNQSVVMSFFVAILWLMSPMNISTSFYIIQRMATLSFLFVMLGCILFCYLRGRQNLAKNRQIIIILAIILCWMLGFLSKETGILLPLYLLVIDFCFFNANTRALLRRIPLTKGYIAVYLVGLVIVVPGLLIQSDVLNYDTRSFTLLQRVVSQPSALIKYISHLLFPVSADIGVYGDDFNVAEGYFNSAGLLNILVIGLLFVGAIYGSVVAEKLRPAMAGMLLFFAGHSLESTVIPLELYFEHRNYFPSFGLYLALVYFMFHRCQESKLRPFLVIILIVYGGYFSVLSVQLSKYWQSYDRFVLNSYLNHPRSVRASIDMTQMLINQDQLEMALKVNNNISGINPNYRFIAMVQRYYSYCELSDGVPPHEYSDFINSINLYSEDELSSALHNLLTGYEKNRCDFIEPIKLSKALSRWTWKGVTNGDIDVGSAWVIDYYAVEFLLVTGNRLDAIEYLERLKGKGNDKAALYLEDIEKDS